MKQKVSLVTTVLNERDSIERWLEGVFAQSRLPDEVVIVDGGSTDGTVDELVRYVSGAPAPVVIVEAPGANIAIGRNVGIARAQGPLIAVSDAGTELDEHWLDAIVEPLERDARLAVSAGFFEAGGRTWFERALSTIITPQLWEVDPRSFLPSSRSVAFRKWAWQQVDGYPEWLDHCEDLVFDLALRDAGLSFAFAPGAVARWTARSTLPAFFRQYFLYARGDGMAGLWPRRHLARYSAYTAGCALAVLSTRRPVAAIVLLGGVTIHMSRFVRRVARGRRFSSALDRARAFSLVPVVVATGDVAKMVGYPVGRWEQKCREVDRPSSSDWAP